MCTPEVIVFNIDGPKKGRPNDPERIKREIQELDRIDWECELEIRSHRENKGIRRAIPEAVSYVMEKYGKAIVLEEDVRVGPQAIEFANQMLERFESTTEVGHISLYNIVDKSNLSNPNDSIRLSRYPESIAWASWESSWRNYRDTLDLAKFSNIAIILRVTKSILETASWLVTFREVQSGRLSSWAYRWTAALWRNNLYSISPNENLVQYSGFDEGAHAFRKAPWKELPIGKYQEDPPAFARVDEKADLWLSKRIFGGSAIGLVTRFSGSIFRMVWRDKN
jgi:hypothetical protein